MQIVESTNYETIISTYFDGRKDYTLVMERSEEKRAKKEIIEEHITVFSEPVSKYLGHFVPACGAAKDIANVLLAFCAVKQIDVTKIDSIVCDGMY